MEETEVYRVHFLKSWSAFGKAVMLVCVHVDMSVFRIKK